MPLPPGTQLGNYQIVAQIGAGGMGDVYRAHDGRLGRDVAIKVLAELRQLEQDRYVSPVSKAMILVGLKRFNEAYDLVQLAFENRDEELLLDFLLGESWRFMDHFQDPRWPALRGRIRDAIKLPEGANPWSKP